MQVAIKTTCAECGTPLWGANLNKRGDLYYCSADFERLSPEEKEVNAKKVRQYADYRKMFDGSGVIELVTNGTFDSDTDWTKGTGWTISSGTATSDGTQSADSVLSQAIATKTQGANYRYVFTVSGYSAGNVKVRQSATHYGTSRSANGTYTETLMQLFPYSTIAISADSNFVGSIDNFSVRRI